MNVSEKKKEANRQNAARSTGPKRLTRFSSRNSYKHGFFAQAVRFETEEEQEEYRQLEADLHLDFKPMGTMEELWVGRAATLLWNQRRIEAMLQMQLDPFSSAALERQLERFVHDSALAETPVFGLQEAARRQGSPWEIREILVRVGNENSEEDAKPPAAKNKHCIEARLGPSIDVLFRYRSMMERSLEKTLDLLEKRRARRLAGNTA